MTKYLWQTILAGVCVGALAFGLLVKPSEGHQLNCTHVKITQAHLWHKWNEVPLMHGRVVTGEPWFVYGNPNTGTSTLLIQQSPTSFCTLAALTKVQFSTKEDMSKYIEYAKKEFGVPNKKKEVKPMKGGMRL